MNVVFEMVGDGVKVVIGGGRDCFFSGLIGVVYWDRVG